MLGDAHAITLLLGRVVVSQSPGGASVNCSDGSRKASIFGDQPLALIGEAPDVVGRDAEHPGNLARYLLVGDGDVDIVLPALEVREHAIDLLF
jgi:hypothetical protein